MNLMNIEDRKALIKTINSDANKKRKADSIYQQDIYKNKLEDHIRTFLSKYISSKSLSQMPIIDEIGMCERIIKQEASIYKEEPRREFHELSPEQKAVMDLIYEDMKYNEKAKIQNRYFKLQRQALSYIVPKKGKLVKKVLMAHQYDIIQSELDPEEAVGYVLSNYNQPKKEEEQRYVVWSPEYNFTMDGKGIILTEKENLPNPIAPMMPFSEAAYEKDGDYYIDEKETCVDFTVFLNAALTEVLHVMRMQGFGQAVVTGSANSIPKAEAIEIGLNSIIVLVSEEGQINPDFKFVNANPDLANSIEVIATVLSAYLSSKGIDPKAINLRGDGKTYSSGFERFLALIEKFEASKDDLAIFRTVEKNDFAIITKWHDTLMGDQVQLLPQYKSVAIGDLAKVNVEFVKPEMTVTDSEKLETTKKAEENGYINKVMAIRKLHNLNTDEEAFQLLEQMDSQRVELESRINTAQASKNAFNGAQVASIVTVVEKVALGLIPRESAIAIITSAFGVSYEIADQMVPVGGTITPEQLKASGT